MSVQNAIRLAFLVIIVVFFQGCATPIDQAMLDQYLTRTYAAPKAKCYDATLAALKDLKTPIEAADPKAGTIKTRRTEAQKVAVASYSQYSGVAETYVADHRYYLAVVGGDKSCTIKATRYQVWQNNVELEKINVKWADQHLWTPLFKEVDDRLGVKGQPVEGAKPAQPAF